MARRRSNRELEVRAMVAGWQRPPVIGRPDIVKRNARASASKTAKKRGVHFDLPMSRGLPDVPDECPICCQHMVSGVGSRNNSPSLDRILPGLGYTMENVWWICHDCNRQKSDLDPARAYEMWDRVWEEIKARGLPLPSTRLRPE